MSSMQGTLRHGTGGLLSNDPPEAWEADAICSQVDPELFFPEKGGSTREAKKVCAGCSVRLECLKSALERGEYWGIYGGTSPRERRAILRTAQKAS